MWCCFPSSLRFDIVLILCNFCTFSLLIVILLPFPQLFTNNLVTRPIVEDEFDQIPAEDRLELEEPEVQREAEESRKGELRSTIKTSVHVLCFDTETKLNFLFVGKRFNSMGNTSVVFDLFLLFKKCMVIKLHVKHVIGDVQVQQELTVCDPCICIQQN